MKEDFLHYVWKFQKFSKDGLRTAHGEKLEIIRPGLHNHNAGPDFFNGLVSIDGQLWAGNIEIHTQSSHWYLHAHESDNAYDNVVLHIVWEHDIEVYGINENPIPTLELKGRIDHKLLSKYKQLFSKVNRWIPCEREFASVDSFVLKNWIDRLYVERLENKSEIILNELTKTNNHWESLLFAMLCKNFGLKVNGESFYSIAKSIDFIVIQKCRLNIENLESLLLGQAHLLDELIEDPFYLKLQEKYKYLKHKFQLKNQLVIAPKYFRLRPANFPSIRLSQLAMLYARQNGLFAKIILASTREEFYQIFKISASRYWDDYYNFGVSSTKRKKFISKSFIDLIIINTLLPLKFCYATHLGKDVSDQIMKIAKNISREDNSIIRKFNDLQITDNNALFSQGLLQLKNEYCNLKRCLQCSIGNSILKS